MTHFTVVHQGVVPKEQKSMLLLCVQFKKNCICKFAKIPTGGAAKNLYRCTTTRHLLLVYKHAINFAPAANFIRACISTKWPRHPIFCTIRYTFLHLRCSHGESYSKNFRCATNFRKISKFWHNLATFVAPPSDLIPQFAQYWTGHFIL